MNISEKIKARRLELGLSVDDIAEKLNINRATYYRYESQEISKFPLEIVVPLSKILDIPPETLMGWDNKKKEPDPRPAYVIEIETLADDMNESQLKRLVEYAKMLKQYKED